MTLDLTTINSPNPNRIAPIPKLTIASQRIKENVYIFPAINFELRTCNRDTGLVSKILYVPAVDSPASKSPATSVIRTVYELQAY